MKRLLTILLLIISVNVFGQIQPQPSGTLVPLSTNQAYFRASDSTYYFYNGTNYLWNYFLNKQQADKLYQPLGSPVATPFSLSAGYGLSGSSFNGSVARTFTADTTSADGLVSKSRLATNLGGYVPSSRTITINGSTRDLTANRIFNVGTVLSVGATAGTGISISGSPITSSGSLTITNTAPDQTVVLNAGTGISTSGTYPNFTITNTLPAVVGIQDSLTKKANRTFDNVASGAIANVKLANSTISGVALGSNLNALTLGNGLTGTSYNGSGSVTATADTTVVQTVSNFFPKGDTRWAKIGDIPAIGVKSISQTPDNNGMSYSNDTLRLHAVTPTTGGVLTNGIDSIGGDKFFTNDIWVTDSQISDGHIGLASGSGSLHAPLLGASSESATNLLEILAHPAANRYNLNPANGIKFQVYINEGPDPITSGNAYNFKNGSYELLKISPLGQSEFLGDIITYSKRVSNGGVTLGSGSGSLMAPSLGGNSESSTAWFNFTGFPATNIDNTNPTDAFKFNAYKSNDGSQALTGGNLVNFFNKDVSKLSVDYNGVITSAGLTNGLVKSTSGTLSNATVASDYTLLNGTGIVEMAGTTPSYLSSTGTGNVVKATSPTLTTPNIGASTFSTLTGGTASTITFANTSAGGIQDAISIRNGGTTAGTGNRINFITGTSTQSARINSVLTSSTVADLVFSTMTGGTLAESGRFLGDKTLQLAAGLNLSGQMTSTMGNNTTLFSSSSATTGYQFFNMQNTAGRLLWGIDGSSGGSFVTGGSAYSGAMTTVGAKNLEFGTNQVKAITIDGTTQDVTIANNITADNLLSGTYTPTLTNGANVASSTAGTGSYQRIGNQVSGFVDFTATGTSEGVSGVFGVSLPIASNFSSATNVWGGYGVARAGETIAPLEEVSADTTNDRFIVKATLTDLSVRTIRINFNYTIL